MASEVWKPIRKSESHEVSNQGRIRNAVTKRIVKPFTDKHQEYNRVTLYEGGRKVKRMVHTLVADAFLGPKPDGCEIDHINTNKHDNRASNLRYVTRAENRNNPFTMFNSEVIRIRRGIAAGKVSKEDILRLVGMMRGVNTNQ